jgi:transposase
MGVPASSDLKCDRLRQNAALNPHPERVSDPLFQTHPFFDPRDLVQVKYEMLRRASIDGQPVGVTAAAFGFSRMSLSQLRKRFEKAGLAGLLAQPKGPQQAHKLSDEILAFILKTQKAEPELRTSALPQRVKQQFGISIHRRSIERAQTRQRKKGGLILKRCIRLPCGRLPTTKFCAARCCNPALPPIPMIRNGFSSSAGGWPPG